MFNFLKNISPVELVIIAAVLILLFGSKAFISMGRTSGQTLKEIKNIKKNLSEVISDDPEKDEKEVSK